MTATLLLLLEATGGVMVLAIGMDSTFKDAAHRLERPVKGAHLFGIYF